MLVFTIFQNKLHPFNIQEDRSTRFLKQQIIELTTDIIKLNNEENSIDATTVRTISDVECS